MIIMLMTEIHQESNSIHQMMSVSREFESAMKLINEFFQKLLRALALCSLQFPLLII